MNSFVSSLEDRNKENALNTCLKSLNNMLDYHQFEEEKQDYTEISYKGTISTVSDMEIKFPRKLGTTLPVVGYIAGYIPLVIGYTDGTSVAPIPNMTKYLSPVEMDTHTEIERLLEKDEPEGTTKVSQEYTYPNGLKVKEDAYTTIYYVEREEVDEEGYTITVYYKTKAIDVIKELNYNEAPIYVFQRF